MSREYQTKVEHQVEAWISKHKTKYDKLLAGERAGTGAKVAGALISIGLILGLAFRLPVMTIGVYAVISLIAIIYSQTVGAPKRAHAKVRADILASNAKLKANYDKELLSTGIGSKVPDAFIKGVLIVFGLLVVAALIFGD